MFEKTSYSKILQWNENGQIELFDNANLKAAFDSWLSGGREGYHLNQPNDTKKSGG